MSQTPVRDGTAQPSHRSRYNGMTRPQPKGFARTGAQHGQGELPCVASSSTHDRHWRTALPPALRAVVRRARHERHETPSTGRASRSPAKDSSLPRRLGSSPSSSCRRGVHRVGPVGLHFLPELPASPASRHEMIRVSCDTASSRSWSFLLSSVSRVQERNACSVRGSLACAEEARFSALPRRTEPVDRVGRRAEEARFSAPPRHTEPVDRVGRPGAVRSVSPCPSGGRSVPSPAAQETSAGSSGRCRTS